MFPAGGLATRCAVTHGALVVQGKLVSQFVGILVPNSSPAHLNACKSCSTQSCSQLGSWGVGMMVTPLPSPTRRFGQPHPGCLPSPHM